VATELLAQMSGECVTKGSFCHHFSRIFEGVYSRVAAEVFCLCLRSSSDPLVGQDWALVILTRTLPLERGLRSVLMVVGQHAYILSLLELDVWLVGEAEEHVATLALSKVQCLLKTLLGDKQR
jgi:hypothetical protein